MSEIAEIERSKRRIWARPGSGHDYLVRVLGIVLPAAVTVIGAVLIAAPLSSTAGDVSFVLAKDSVDIAKERLRVVNAVYRGEDSKGRAFILHAGSAVQKTSREPIIRINDIAAELAMAEGPATIAAKTAAFNMDSDTLSVIGPVNFQSADGYRLDMNNVSVNLKTRQVVSNSSVGGVAPEGSFAGGQIAGDVNKRTISMGGGVSGTTPMGSFRGGTMTADLNTRRVSVAGNASGSTKAGAYQADQLTLDQRARTVVLSGNARFTSNVSIAANRIVVTDAGGTNRAEASGGVTVRRGDQVGRSAFASYDEAKRLVRLSGGVVLTQGSNVMRGGTMTINLNTKAAIVEGGGGTSGNSDSGRVSGTFGVKGQ